MSGKRVRPNPFTIVMTLAAAGLAVMVAAAPASACGGLVGENGTIQLGRTTTLAAYHNGVEHYVTSFEFTGEGEEVGSIVPLPGVPSLVERGGDWTLQRLQREVAPKLEAGADRATSATAADVNIILETKIDALDITILSGGGTEVGKWAVEHGFLLTPDAPEVLDFYSQRSPVFMAARFDATEAKARGQNAGDGTPIHLTIPTQRPWVPLRILGLGLDQDATVNADVFLLTDKKPQIRLGAAVDLERSEKASSSLLDDLRSDKGMEWIPNRAHLSFLTIDSAAGTLDYDLALSVEGGLAPSLRDAGVNVATQSQTGANPGITEDDDRTVLIAGITAAVALAIVGGWLALRRTSTPPSH